MHRTVLSLLRAGSLFLLSLGSLGLFPLAVSAGPGADLCTGDGYTSLVRLDGSGFVSQHDCIDYSNAVGSPIHGTPVLAFALAEPSMRLINAHEFSPGTKLSSFSGMYHITLSGQGLLPGSDISVTNAWNHGATEYILDALVGPDGTFLRLLGFTDCDGGLGDIVSWTLRGTALDGTPTLTTVSPPC